MKCVVRGGKYSYVFLGLSAYTPPSWGSLPLVANILLPLSYTMSLFTLYPWYLQRSLAFQGYIFQLLP